jgi:hypothetical protein
MMEAARIGRRIERPLVGMVLGTGASCSMTGEFGRRCSRSVRQETVAQMAFTEYYNMINAFPADRTDQPLGICIFPG